MGPLCRSDHETPLGFIAHCDPVCDTGSDGGNGFFLPFNLLTVSVHSLLGFVFIAAIGWHIKNNLRQLRSYFSKPSSMVALVIVMALVGFILIQPTPVKAVLRLSDNLGPDPDRFEESRTGKTEPGA